jgi:hypothetical protein
MIDEYFEKQNKEIDEKMRKTKSPLRYTDLAIYGILTSLTHIFLSYLIENASRIMAGKKKND